MAIHRYEVRVKIKVRQHLRIDLIKRWPSFRHTMTASYNHSQMVFQRMDMQITKICTEVNQNIKIKSRFQKLVLSSLSWKIDQGLRKLAGSLNLFTNSIISLQKNINVLMRKWWVAKCLLIRLSTIVLISQQIQRKKMMLNLILMTMIS